MPVGCFEPPLAHEHHHHDEHDNSHAFGDLAKNINQRVEPAAAEEEICLGQDDLDCGSPHIRQRGKGSEVIGTKLRFAAQRYDDAKIASLTEAKFDAAHSAAGKLKAIPEAMWPLGLDWQNRSVPRAPIVLLAHPVKVVRPCCPCDSTEYLARFAKGRRR